jgi:hypothetical protein
MSTKRKLAGNVSLVALSALLALLLGEWLLYEFFPQKTLYPRYQTTSGYRLIFPPDAELHHAQGRQWSFSYVTNQLGHRGILPAPEDTQDTINIVAVGDSFTFGMGVGEGAVYTDRLAREIGKGYSVLNAGMAGWGLDAEIKRYYEIFAAYEPRYVVLQFTQNDPLDSITGVTAIRDGRFEFADYSWRKPGWQQMLSESELLQNSQIYAAIRSMVEAIGETRKEQSNADSIQQLEAAYSDLLTLFARELKARGTRLLFLSVTHRHPDVLYHYDVNHFPLIEATLANLSEANLIQIIDLPLAELKAHQGSPEGHQWNVEHHRIVGDAIAETILKLESADRR